MAIFTPESKFLNMMKTTLDTNKYFMENNMSKKYYKGTDSSTKDTIKEENKSDIDIYYTYPTKVDSSNIIYDTPSNSNIVGVIDPPSNEDINNKYEEFRSFSEQQIKVNKQTKNNYDRLNKKITVSTEKIEEKITEIENDIWRRLLDHEQISNNNYLAIIEKLDEYKKDIRDKYIKILAFISFGILSNLILFACLSLK